MKNVILLLVACLLSAPAWAQLGYQTGASPSAAQEKKTEELPTVVRKTRTSEASVRPDWYALFLLWAKAHPQDVLQGLREQKSFDNFSQFLACDWVRDFRQNDVVWPTKQTQIVQKFNEHVLGAQTQFKLLARGVLGTYMPDQQQFVFHPLEGAVFSFEFPVGKPYGIEDDCNIQNNHVVPLAPWPEQFVLAFRNPSLVEFLPMEKSRAEYFVANLPKNNSGGYDRHVVLEINLTFDGFDPNPIKQSNGDTNQPLPPVGILATAQNVIVYADTARTKELARYGFPAAATPAAPPK